MKRIIFLVAIMAVLTTACGEHEEVTENDNDGIIVETIEVETIEVETIIH